MGRDGATEWRDGEGSGRVAIVADAHVGGPGGDVGPLLSQLRELPERGCGRLVLLGDIFQAWVGFDHFETEPVRKLAAMVLGLREQGLRVDYVEGNRDFYLDHSASAAAFDTIAEEVSLTSAGRRVLAVHGDGLDDRDLRYRFWRAVSKSAPVRLLVRSLPPRAARRLVASTDRRLADTNFKHRARIPEEVIRAYGRRRLAEGHDLVVLGHFHEERLWEVPEGRIWLLEAWFSSRRVEWLDHCPGPSA